MAARTATARRAPVEEPEILPALPEQQLTAGDGQTILSFLGGLVPFFREAQTLEASAREKLAKARLFTLPQPGDIDGDATLQAFIKECSADKKTVESHWSITSTFSQMHKKLVAGRQRAVTMLEEAGGTAQRLHNTFVEDARRRAAEEQRRREEAERRRQEEARQQELARLEAEALEKEAASADLSDRERSFVDLVFAGRTPSVAAKAVGYKPADQGERLMAMPKIQRALDAKREAELLRQQATAVKETPLDVQVDQVKPEYTKAGTDRTTYAAELVNERLLIEAVLGGQHGIPSDVLTINQVALNRYARDLREVLNRWPGVRLKKTTKTI